MKKVRLSALLCALLLSLSVLTPALADAAVEAFWDFAYNVDYDVYVNSSDGVGVNVRYGPGTKYETTYWEEGMGPIPDGEKLHISMECPSDYGYKWGLIDQEVGGHSYYGWVSLSETSTQPPAPASTPLPTPEPTQPSTPEPTQTVVPTETPVPGPETPQPTPAPTVEPRPDVQVVTPLVVAMIGIVVACVAAAAAILLVLVRRKK